MIFNEPILEDHNNNGNVVASRKKDRCGRKAVPLDLEQLRNIPLKQRMTIEDVSSKLGMSKVRIQRYLKKSLLR
jgi:DNA-binding transcriptional regulator LsrR (DeoR family)